MMYYKLDLLPDGRLEVVDMVEEKKNNDGFLYATQEEYDRLEPSNIINQLDLKGFLT
ncbi:MAG: hypothetical protein NC218_08090 [Acetobacter sp.]|nr:hypothetical protein [Acetobacter sp.]